MFLPLTPIRCLLWAAQEYGAKIGVVDRGRRLSYCELLDRSLRLAHALRSACIVPGDRVATLSFNCHQLLEAYYGVPMARAILLPLNVRLSPEEQIYVLEHSGTTMVLFDPALLPLAEAIHKDLPCLQWVSLEPHESLPTWVRSQTYDDWLAAASPQPIDFTTYDENSIAELFYTSGSTGCPKGVMLSHRTLYLHCLSTLLGTYRAGHREAADQTIELHTIPLFHANGWGRAHTVTFTGGRHVMVQRFDPVTVYGLIQQEKVTTLAVVPTMATAMIHFPDTGQYDLSSLREVMLGGAAASPTLIRDLEKKLGCPAFAGYGLTETSPVATVAHIKETVGEISGEERIRRKAMTGYCFSGTEVCVVDADGKDVPKDSVTMGEIIFRSDIVMDGYWNDPEATAQAIQDNWLHTGDVAVWDEHQYVLIVDRKKDIIISGGENISSLEIEKVIVSHPAVYEVAVVAIPDEKWGEVPKAFVVLKPGASTTEKEIQDLVRQHLADFKIPRSVEFIGELPKGSTGKILKRALRDPYWEGMGKYVHGGNNP